MALAPFVYLQVPTLGMNSHLMDYGGGYNRIPILPGRSAQEAFESMTGQSLPGFYGDQGVPRSGREGDPGTVRVKQEPLTDQGFGGTKYPGDPAANGESPVVGGKYPGDPSHGLGKYHQAGKMFALGKYRERDLVNREKEFLDMLCQGPSELLSTEDVEGSKRAGDFTGPQPQLIADAGGSEEEINVMMNAIGSGGMRGGVVDEACDLSRRSASTYGGGTSGSAPLGSTGSSPGSMSPPSPQSRTSLMTSQATGLPMAHSPLPFVSATGMPLSPMSSLLLSPSSPGMPPSPLPPYHPQAAQHGNSLYYLHRGHQYRNIFGGAGHHQHRGKHMHLKIKTEPVIRKRSTSTNVDTGSDYSDDLTSCLPDPDEEPLDCSLGYDQVLQDSQISSGKRGARLNRKPFKHKVCLVCGDKALGYNFNAVSCESCKAFFRRNAYRTIRGRCEGKCEVTVESRSYCKKCRLAKCFTVGMKKELILNDKQKMLRKRKIEANRMRKNGMPMPSPGLELEDEEVEETLPKEGRESPVPPPPAPAVTHAFASEVSENDLSGLTEQSRLQIDEVLSAFRVSFDAPIDKTVYDNPSGSQFLNMADMSVNRLVIMAKHLKVFKALDQGDQISLLKGSVLEVLILRSVKLFDSKRQTWHVKQLGEEHQIKSTSLESEYSSSVFFDQYKRFVMGTVRATRCDNTVLMFLMVMSVFSSDRPNVKEQRKIMDAQEMFAEVLRDYLNHKYPSHPLMFPRILQRLADIRELQENHARMMLKMNVNELQPLIVEIFDLNSGSTAQPGAGAGATGSPEPTPPPPPPPQAGAQ